MEEKKYNPLLLIPSIFILLFSIVYFALTNYYKISPLVTSNWLTSFSLIAISIMLMLQFKGYKLTIFIILLSVGTINLLFPSAIPKFREYDPYYRYDDEGLHIFYMISILLTYASLVISSLFALLNEVQPKLEIKYTRLLVLILLSFSLLMLVLSTVLYMIRLYNVNILEFKHIFIASLYDLLSLITGVVLYLLIQPKPDKPIVAPSKPAIDSRLIQLDNLRAKGLITDEEYNSRKDTL